MKQSTQSILIRNLLCATIILTPLAYCRAEKDNHSIVNSNNLHKHDLSEVFSYIVNSEYDIRWQSSVGAWGSANHGQGLHFTYLPDGFSAGPVAHRAHPWKITLRLISFGSKNPVDSAVWSKIKVDGHAVRFTTDEVIYDYTNGVAGMRQNFIVKRKPQNGRLRLELAAELNGVEMGVDTAGDFAYFAEVVSKHQVMRYTDLKVWDAKGRKLSAKMTLLANDRLAIAVDDRDAQYPVVVDPLSLAWSLSGSSYSFAQGGQFGFSVAASHNGFIVVGAPYWIDENGSQVGKVFAFAETSSGGINTTPYWTAVGPQSGDEFGYSVTVADDGHSLNGDFYPDLIVGAPLYNASGSQAGGVFVWYGQPSGVFHASADWSAGYGMGYQSQFGFSVGTAFRLAGTDQYGLDSLVVGAPYYNNDPYTSAGAVYVYYGDANGLPSSPSWSQTGIQSDGEIGFSVGGAYNVDGSGHGVVIIGAPYESPGGNVYVYSSNGSALGGSPTLTLSTPQSQLGASFGYSVAGVPSFRYVSQQYEGAFAVGAPGWPVSGNANAGSVFVYDTLGSSTPAAQITYPTQAGAQFGYSVAGGDIDNNFYGDVIVGAPFQECVPTTNDQGGWVYVWYSDGTGGINSVGDAICAIHPDHSKFGASVAFMPLVSGHTGVLAGAPNDKDGTSSAYGSIEGILYSP